MGPCLYCFGQHFLSLQNHETLLLNDFLKLFWLCSIDVNFLWKLVHEQIVAKRRLFANIRYSHFNQFFALKPFPLCTIWSLWSVFPYLWSSDPSTSNFVPNMKYFSSNPLFGNWTSLFNLCNLWSMNCAIDGSVKFYWLLALTH